MESRMKLRTERVKAGCDVIFEEHGIEGYRHLRR